MSYLYWLVKLAWYFIMTVIATTYWKGYGYWFLVICAILLLLGDEFLKKLFKRNKM